MPALKPSPPRKPATGALTPPVAHPAAKRLKPMTLEGAVADALVQAQGGHVPVQATTARLRNRALGDRRVKLEFYADTKHNDSVLVRIRLASPANEASPATEPPADPLLSTQEAAAMLLVSRPYVTKLVDQGSFNGIVRTSGGHRRIPQSEVLRVRQEMKDRMRRGLDDMLEIAAPAMRRELQSTTRQRPGKPSNKSGR